MILIDEKNLTEVASASLAHFFVGLIKADAGLSVAEVRKVELLIYKMRKMLPGEYEQIISFLHEIQQDNDYLDWNADRHGTEGLRLFDILLASNTLHYQRYIDSILELMEIIVEVGDISEGEEKFLARMFKEFGKRKKIVR